MNYIYPPVLESRGKAIDSLTDEEIVITFAMPGANNSNNIGHCQVVAKDKETGNYAWVPNLKRVPDKQVLYIQKGQGFAFDDDTNSWKIKIPIAYLVLNKAKNYIFQVRFGEEPLWPEESTNKEFESWYRRQVSAIPSKFGEWSNIQTIYVQGHVEQELTVSLQHFLPEVKYKFRSSYDEIYQAQITYKYFNFLDKLITKQLVNTSVKEQGDGFYNLEFEIPVAPIMPIEYELEVITVNNAIYKQSGKIGSIAMDYAQRLQDYQLKGEELNDGVIAKEVLPNKENAVNTDEDSGIAIFRCGLYSFECIKIDDNMAARAIMRDYTVEMGEHYMYLPVTYGNSENDSAILHMSIFDWGNLSHPYHGRLSRMDAVFLSDNNHQLKIEGNVSVSGLKPNVSDSFQTTIGSKYPFYSRSAETNYRTFTLNGVITINSDKTFSFLYNDGVNGLRWDRDYQDENPEMILFNHDLYSSEEFTRSRRRVKDTGSGYNRLIDYGVITEELSGPASMFDAITNDQGDTEEYLHRDIFPKIGDMYNDESVFVERKFREYAMKWLSDGKPKLFRSETEGNMIVMVSSVSFSPVEHTSRIIYSMSATLTEIAECNLEELQRYNLICTDLKTTRLGSFPMYFRRGDKVSKEDYNVFAFLDNDSTFLSNIFIKEEDGNYKIDEEVGEADWKRFQNLVNTITEYTFIRGRLQKITSRDWIYQKDPTWGFGNIPTDIQLGQRPTIDLTKGFIGKIPSDYTFDLSDPSGNFMIDGNKILRLKKLKLQEKFSVCSKGTLKVTVTVGNNIESINIGYGYFYNPIAFSSLSNDENKEINILTRFTGQPIQLALTEDIKIIDGLQFDTINNSWTSYNYSIEGSVPDGINIEVKDIEIDKGQYEHKLELTGAFRSKIDTEENSFKIHINDAVNDEKVITVNYNQIYETPKLQRGYTSYFVQRGVKQTINLSDYIYPWDDKIIDVVILGMDTVPFSYLDGKITFTIPENYSETTFEEDLHLKLFVQYDKAGEVWEEILVDLPIKLYKIYTKLSYRGSSIDIGTRGKDGNLIPVKIGETISSISIYKDIVSGYREFSDGMVLNDDQNHNFFYSSSNLYPDYEISPEGVITGTAQVGHAEREGVIYVKDRAPNSPTLEIPVHINQINSQLVYKNDKELVLPETYVGQAITEIVPASFKISECLSGFTKRENPELEFSIYGVGAASPYYNIGVENNDDIVTISWVSSPTKEAEAGVIQLEVKEWLTDNKDNPTEEVDYTRLLIDVKVGKIWGALTIDDTKNTIYINKPVGTKFEERLIRKSEESIIQGGKPPFSVQIVKKNTEQKYESYPELLTKYNLELHQGQDTEQNLTNITNELSNFYVSGQAPKLNNQENGFILITDALGQQVPVDLILRSYGPLKYTLLPDCKNFYALANSNPITVNIAEISGGQYADYSIEPETIGNFTFSINKKNILQVEISSSYTPPSEGSQEIIVPNQINLKDKLTIINKNANDSTDKEELSFTDDWLTPIFIKPITTNSISIGDLKRKDQWTSSNSLFDLDSKILNYLDFIGPELGSSIEAYQKSFIFDKNSLKLSTAPAGLPTMSQNALISTGNVTDSIINLQITDSAEEQQPLLWEQLHQIENVDDTEVIKKIKLHSYITNNEIFGPLSWDPEEEVVNKSHAMQPISTFEQSNDEFLERTIEGFETFHGGKPSFQLVYDTQESSDELIIELDSNNTVTVQFSESSYRSLDLTFKISKENPISKAEFSFEIKDANGEIIKLTVFFNGLFEGFEIINPKITISGHRNDYVYPDPESGTNELLTIPEGVIGSGDYSWEILGSNATIFTELDKDSKEHIAGEFLLDTASSQKTYQIKTLLDYDVKQIDGKNHYLFYDLISEDKSYISITPVVGTESPYARLFTQTGFDEENAKGFSLEGIEFPDHILKVKVTDNVLNESGVMTIQFGKIEGTLSQNKIFDINYDFENSQYDETTTFEIQDYLKNMPKGFTVTDVNFSLSYRNGFKTKTTKLLNWNGKKLQLSIGDNPNSQFKLKIETLSSEDYKDMPELVISGLIEISYTYTEENETLPGVLICTVKLVSTPPQITIPYFDPSVNYFVGHRFTGTVDLSQLPNWKLTGITAEATSPWEGEILENDDDDSIYNIALFSESKTNAEEIDWNFIFKKNGGGQVIITKTISMPTIYNDIDIKNNPYLTLDTTGIKAADLRDYYLNSESLNTEIVDNLIINYSKVSGISSIQFSETKSNQSFGGQSDSHIGGGTYSIIEGGQKLTVVYPLIELQKDESTDELISTDFKLPIEITSQNSNESYSIEINKVKFSNQISNPLQIVFKDTVIPEKEGFEIGNVENIPSGYSITSVSMNNDATADDIKNALSISYNSGLISAIPKAGTSKIENFDSGPLVLDIGFKKGSGNSKTLTEFGTVILPALLPEAPDEELYQTHIGVGQKTTINYTNEFEYWSGHESNYTVKINTNTGKFGYNGNIEIKQDETTKNIQIIITAPEHFGEGLTENSVYLPNFLTLTDKNTQKSINHNLRIYLVNPTDNFPSFTMSRQPSGFYYGALTHSAPNYFRLNGNFIVRANKKAYNAICTWSFSSYYSITVRIYTDVIITGEAYLYQTLLKTVSPQDVEGTYGTRVLPIKLTFQN